MTIFFWFSEFFLYIEGGEEEEEIEEYVRPIKQKTLASWKDQNSMPQSHLKICKINNINIFLFSFFLFISTLCFSTWYNFSFAQRTSFLILILFRRGVGISIFLCWDKKLLLSSAGENFIVGKWGAWYKIFRMLQIFVLGLW